MKKIFLVILLVLALSLNAGAANYYVDLASGNDTTGDGSTGNPYKTPYGVSQNEVLTGGDEIRVKKSTITAITGTCTFTNGSLEIATDADRTGEVSAGDYVSKNSDTPDGNEHWWVVSSVDADSINLYEAYWGSTEATTAYVVTPPTIGSGKWNILDSGTSTSSRILISGGWDFTGPTRDGYTATWDTGAYGAIEISTSDFIELGYVIASYNSVLDGSVNIKSEGIYLHHIYCLGISYYGALDIDGAHNLLIENVYANSGDSGFTANITDSNNVVGTNIHSSSSDSNDYALLIVDCSNIFLNGVYLTQNDSTAAKIQESTNIYIGNLNVTEVGGTGHAIEIFSSFDIYFDEPVFTDIAGNGFYIGSSTSVVQKGIYIKDPTFTSVTGTNYYLNPGSGGGPVIGGPTMVLDISGVHYSYFMLDSSALDFDTPGSEGPFFGSNTAEARSGTCIKIMPEDVDLYVPVAVGTIKVTSAAGDLTLSVYIKKDGSFDGQVFMYARQNYENVVAPTKKTVTTSYVQYSITVDAADLTVGEYVELSVMASGSAGNIYIDDFSYSQ